MRQHRRKGERISEHTQNENVDMKERQEAGLLAKVHTTTIELISQAKKSQSPHQQSRIHDATT